MIEIFPHLRLSKVKILCPCCYKYFSQSWKQTEFLFQLYPPNRSKVLQVKRFSGYPKGESFSNHRLTLTRKGSCFLTLYAFYILRYNCTFMNLQASALSFLFLITVWNRFLNKVLRNFKLGNFLQVFRPNGWGDKSECICTCISFVCSRLTKFNRLGLCILRDDSSFACSQSEDVLNIAGNSPDE